MKRWPLVIEPTSEDVPVFLRIARALVADIRRGRLPPGHRLPGSRTLAAELGVHRNTVLAALAELEAQGWLSTLPAKGTFVATSLPEATVGPPSRAGTAPLGFDLPELVPLSGSPMTESERSPLNLSAGSPDPRLFPVELIARTWRRVVRRSGRHLLGYGHPAGHLALRQGLAEMISELRGVPATADTVLVTRGSQMALELCARAVLRPGDTVAVEAFGYRPAWDALRLAGAKLVSVPVDAEGIDVAALERLAKRRRLRALYVTPHHQFPTTVTLSAARRLALLSLARRHRLLVLEDDYDHEFHYEGRPVLPLASADDAGVVAYIGTLSKVLAPGLRLGFVIGPRALMERLAALRAVMDRQGDHPMEATVAELLEEGELQRHIRKTRMDYLGRRDALAGALSERLGHVLRFNVPRGGISLWASLTRPVDLPRWLAASEARGIVVSPGSRYTFDGHEPGALRLVFARFSSEELRRAVEVLRQTLPSR